MKGVSGKEGREVREGCEGVGDITGRRKREESSKVQIVSGEWREVSSRE